MDIPSLTFLQKISKIKPNLTNLLNAIYISCKIIQREISKAGIIGLHGLKNELKNKQNSELSMNSSGDIQKKLDVISNELIIENLINSGMCTVLLSEENEEEIIVSEEYKGKFIVAFDPLDGSSNIDCNVCVGTIFSIYEQTDINWRNCIDGDKIICAGYCLYGPATELVITFDSGSGVLRFILDQSIGEFIYVGKINIPDEGKKIYSVNESNYENWEENIKKYVSLYKEKNTKYTQRYIGSMVADVHRTLLYGGMFMYPGDKKNRDGKLRVFYECFPMARIVEESGGYAITMRNDPVRILDIKPKYIHQKTPILLGSKEEVNKFIV
jgi:fructose-1,6-bisphosphatase I